MIKEDAVDLAEALEAALPDVPDGETLADKVLTPGSDDYTRYIGRPLSRVYRRMLSKLSAAVTR
jgi:hypothetical protein